MPQSYIIDSQSSYVYIIGFPSANSSKIEQKRIDLLSSVAPSDHAITPSKEQQRAISEYQDRDSGIFSTEKMISVDVLLSELGIVKLSRIQWLRPSYTIDGANDRLYHFTCTRKNALYYFQRFGADAVIVSPTELKKEMAEIYQAALDAYKA